MNNKRHFFLLFLVCMMVVLNVHALALSDTIKTYANNANTPQYVSFGTFKQGENGEVMPIVWRVLSSDSDRVYLYSEYILEARRIDPVPRPYAGWEKSELYEYLNNAFKNECFTALEQSALVLSLDDNALVTLPTIDDIRNKAYGFVDNKSRQSRSTEYAKANGLYVYSGNIKYSPYWSKTPSENHPYAHRRIMDDGKTGYICVEVKNLGMRPAIYVNPQVLDIQGGEGTLDAPYALVVKEQTEETQTPAPEQNAEDEKDVEKEQEETPVTNDTQSTQTSETNESKKTAENASATLDIVPVTYDPLFPPLTKEGFLQAGQEDFVFTDNEKGKWLYASQDLRIEILRVLDTNKKKSPLRYLVADVFVRDQSDFLKIYYNEKENPKKETEIKNIAINNSLVFAINGDFHHYRVKRNLKKRVMPVGVILRENQILYDDPTKKLSNSVPTRDILALYPNCDMQVYDYNEITAQQLKDLGAYDVLSFGPILLKDGEITAQTINISNRQSDNPRSGIGMVQKGHYVAIMAEGRISESKGCTLIKFAELFQQKNCVTAYNLDGGGTATMLFMGEYINKLGSYTADKRLQNELLGIGVIKK